MAIVVLITGASTGLGYEVVRALCRSSRQHDIILAGMTVEMAAEAAKVIAAEFLASADGVWPIGINVEDDQSIQQAVKFVEDKFGKLDVLVHNAGVQYDPDFNSGKMSMREAWNKTWSVNTVGSQVTTHAFVPLLLQSTDPRLLFISSGTSTLAGTENSTVPMNQSPAKGWPKSSGTGVPAYRSCKTGINMMMREWHRVLNQDLVKVWAISPGYLATGLGGSAGEKRQQGALEPSVGGLFIRYVIEGHRDADVGKVITRFGIQPW